MLALIARTIEFLVYHVLVHVVDRVSRLPRSGVQPEVERLLRENLALKVQVRALVLQLKSERGARPRVSLRTRAAQVFAYLLTRGGGLFLAGATARPRGWVLLEVQTSVDRDKLESIPLGFEMTRRRYPRTKGDVVLVTATESVARYFDAHPFESRGSLGTRRTLEVVRMDLSRLAPGKLLDRRHPHLGLLAVAGRRQRDDAGRVAQRAVALAVREREPLRTRLVDAILGLVDATIRRELESEMERQGYRTPFLRNAYNKGKAEGEAKGKAEGEAKGLRSALLRVIAGRSFVLPPEIRERIERETDQGRLERWLEAAVTARTITDVFADG